MDTTDPLTKADKTCTLSEMPNGARVKVTGFSCDKALRSRLCALGITPGTELDLKHICNALSVKVKECNLVIDDNVASEILCTPLSECCCKKKRGFGCLKKLLSKTDE
ncbi:FeoA family protein [Desulfovibrio litoralis]|uniref:Fe2+ transport system protein FeoA n=1 Tax=Desulfovibrio litoralis DSM 11393 TaxID=1121455 RepID=A0A1M7RR94_9BACT|nr:FeoA family protein [Desulfovibrio litoralis]SHN48857.1 Fe2+ transport system protein FeoA [Desulfovibrio litoralis DSM 11393]